jgi:hypothetical protein
MYKNQGKKTMKMYKNQGKILSYMYKNQGKDKNTFVSNVFLLEFYIHLCKFIPILLNKWCAHLSPPSTAALNSIKRLGLG